MKKQKEQIDDALILRVLENRADENEINLFNAWHSKSAQNAELFTELKKTYDLSSADVHSKSNSWEQVVNKVRAGYNVPRYIDLPEIGKQGKSIRLRMLLRVAAVVLLVAGIAFLLQNIEFNSEQIIISGKNMKNDEAYLLNDGSRVYLNGDSEISFQKNFGSKSRAVSLKGEAFFEIAKNKNMPFVITSKSTSTKVVGTSFNVYSNSAGVVKVSVVSGIVEFASDSKEAIRLIAGEEGVLNPESGDIEKNTIENLNFQSWKTGIFTFNNTEADTALRLLSSYYSKVFVFDDKMMPMPNLTTTFHKQPLESVLEELNLLLNTENVMIHDTIIFKKMH